MFEYAWDRNNVVIPIFALVRRMITYIYLYADGVLVINIVLVYYIHVQGFHIFFKIGTQSNDTDQIIL